MRVGILDIIVYGMIAAVVGVIGVIPYTSYVAVRKVIRWFKT